MMESILSLQLLATDVGTTPTTCSNSSVSCPSKASCYSHNSAAQVANPGDKLRGW